LLLRWSGLVVRQAHLEAGILGDLSEDFILSPSKDKVRLL